MLSAGNKKKKIKQNKKPHRLYIKTRAQDPYCRDFVVVCHAIAKLVVRPA